MICLYSKHTGLLTWKYRCKWQPKETADRGWSSWESFPATPAAARVDRAATTTLPPNCWSQCAPRTSMWRHGVSSDTRMLHTQLYALIQSDYCHVLTMYRVRWQWTMYVSDTYNHVDGDKCSNRRMTGRERLSVGNLLKNNVELFSIIAYIRIVVVYWKF